MAGPRDPLLALRRRPLRSWPRAAAALLLIATAASATHVAILHRITSRRAGAALDARLAAVKGRLDRLIAATQGAAASVAGWPETGPALHGNRAALERLFRRLERAHGQEAVRSAYNES